MPPPKPQRPPDPRKAPSWRFIGPDQGEKKLDAVLRALVEAHPESERYKRYSAHWLIKTMRRKERQPNPMWRGQVWEHKSSAMYLLGFLRDSALEGQVSFCITGTSTKRGAAPPANSSTQDLMALNELCCELLAQGAEEIEILYQGAPFDLQLTNPNKVVPCATDDPEIQAIWKIAAENFEANPQVLPYIEYDGEAPLDDGDKEHDPWLGEVVHRWKITPLCPPP